MYAVTIRRSDAFEFASTAVKDFVKTGPRLLRHGVDFLTVVDIAWLYNHDTEQDAG